MAENLAYTLVKSNATDAPQQTLARVEFGATTIQAADYTEIDTGFKPRYVCVENVTTQAKFEWYESATTTVTAPFVVGSTYKILSPSNTNFMLIGAPDNNAGTEFIATGVGTGAGTATTNDNVCIKTTSAGARSLITANSILVRDRVIQLSQNLTTGIIAINTVLAIRAIA